MTRLAAVVAVLLAALAAALLVPTLFFRPWAVDHFYTRLFVQLAWRRPLLLSQLRVLEPLGLRFHNDDLNDLSVEFQEAEADWVEHQLAILRRYDRQRLDGDARVSYDTVAWFLEDTARRRPYMLHDYPVNQFSGAQSRLTEFMLTGHRLDDLRDARDYVARVRRFEEAFAQLGRGLQERRRRGIVAPAFVLRLVLREMRELIAVEPVEHPLFLHLAAELERLDVPAGERDQLLAELDRALSEQLYPAYRGLIEVVEELEQAGGGRVGAWTLPDGEAFYDHTLDHHATIDVTPEEVHRAGLAEVARIEEEIRRVLGQLGLPTERPAAEIRRLAREDRFLYGDDETGHRRMLDDYRRILGGISDNLERLFEERPPGALEVAAVPEAEQSGAPAAFYRLPAADGSRPATFFVNLREIRRVPRFAMRTLAYHEAIPGHHCQSSLADADGGALLLRRLLPLTAFVEGWALYAEALAAEEGYLDDPYDRLGYLDAELFRSVRLVVDTGIHQQRWDRRRAVEYMSQTTALPRNEVLVEVERQIVNPGQACAYKIGQLRILELRRRARARLGDGFDLRRFHTAVLEHGALPLAILEGLVEQWIESELEGGGSSAG